MTSTFSGLIHDKGFNTANALDITAAATTLDPTYHAGRLITCALAAGQTYTLPAATGSGIVFRFIVRISYTGNGIIKVANSSDTMIGFELGGILSGATPFVGSIGGTDDTITMNGTTTGGLVGTEIQITDYAPNLWYVNLRNCGSGTMATALSATV